MCRTFPPFRLQPPVAVPGDRSGFVPEPTARPAGRIPLGTKASFGLHHHSEAGHDNRPNRVRHPTDQRFTSSCSPPPLTRTQLLSVTTFRPNLARTFTLLIQHTYKRTSAAIHRRFGLISRHGARGGRFVERLSRPVAAPVVGSFDRGREGRLVSASPPSEPDGRFSRIRLSG